MDAESRDEPGAGGAGFDPRQVVRRHELVGWLVVLWTVEPDGSNLRSDERLLPPHLDLTQVADWAKQQAEQRDANATTIDAVFRDDRGDLNAVRLAGTDLDEA